MTNRSCLRRRNTDGKKRVPTQVLPTVVIKRGETSGKLNGYNDSAGAHLNITEAGNTDLNVSPFPPRF